MIGGVLYGHQGSAAPFTTGGETLQDAQENQDDGCCDADLLVGGKQADQSGGCTHSEQGHHQGDLAAVLVTDVASDNGAERAEQEADTQ